MKKIYFSLLIIVLCSYSCKKEMPDTDDAISVQNFSALLSGNEKIPMILVSGDKTITALNAITGDEIFFNEELRYHNNFALSQTPLIIGDGAVLFAGNKIIGVNLKAKTEKWSTNIGSGIGSYEKYISSPPFIYDATIYFTLKYYNNQGFNTRNTFISLNPENGKVNWETNLGKFTEVGAPFQVPVCTNGHAIVAVADTLYAFDRITGERKWVFGGAYNCKMLNPAIQDDKVFIAADINSFTATDSLFALDNSTGAVLWSREYESFGFNAAPVYQNGKLYINITQGIACLNPETGTELWRTNIDNYTFSPIFADGDQLFVSTSYNQVLFSMNASSGNINWQTTVVPFSSLSNLNEGPVVLGDLVYVRNSSYYALDKNTGALKWNTFLHDINNPPFTPNIVNAQGEPVFYSASGMR